MDTDLIQISTTADDRGVLEAIATALVDNRLAACCQLEGPILSVYRWEGKVEQAEEFRLLVKTLRSRYDEVESTVLKMHPYDQPQITAIKIVTCESEYGAWVVASVDDLVG